MQQFSRKDKINNLLLSVYILETVVCQIIDRVVHIPFVSVVLMLLIFILTLINNKNFGRRSNASSTFVIVCILLMFAISFIMVGGNDLVLYFAYFITFGLTAFVLLKVTNINIEHILKCSLFISALYLLGYFLLARNSLLVSDEFWNKQMGQAYGVLTPAIIAFMTLVWKSHFGFSNKYIYLSLTNLLLCVFIIIFDCGTRGAILALFVSVLMIIIARCYKSKSIKYIYLLMAILVLFISNTVDTLLFIDDYLTKIGLDIPALSKSVRLLEFADGMDNGRNDTYVLAINIFKENPIFGSGIGYYETVSKNGYAHNIFLQMLCEFGIIVTALFCFYMIKNFIKVFHGSYMDSNKLFGQLLFLSTIPCLCFSSSYWLLPSFWLYFWNLIKPKSYNC